MKITTLVPAAALACALVLPATAHAEETDCRGSLGAVTVDNLRVPEGATCTLAGTSVKGTVKVERGAVLRASRVTVVGNVQAENAGRVGVNASRVDGSIQVVQGAGADIRDTVVNSDVQIFSNAGAASTVIANAIDGNLQCKENTAPPAGGGNRVRGNAEDQCAALAGGAGPGSVPAATPSPSSSVKGRARVLGVTTSRTGRRVVARVACSGGPCRVTLSVVVRGGRTVARRTVTLADGRRASYRIAIPARHASAVRRGGVRVRAVS